MLELDYYKLQLALCLLTALLALVAPTFLNRINGFGGNFTPLFRIIGFGALFGAAWTLRGISGMSNLPHL